MTSSVVGFERLVSLPVVRRRSPPAGAIADCKYRSHDWLPHCVHHFGRFALQDEHDFVIVYRCSLCLWFAIAGYVVAMWVDVTNPRGSRASKMLWRVYIVSVVAYIIMVPSVTVLAFEGPADTERRPLLAVPDIVRMVGEVLILLGFLYSGLKIWRGYRYGGAMLRMISVVPCVASRGRVHAAVERESAQRILPC